MIHHGKTAVSGTARHGRGARLVAQPEDYFRLYCDRCPTGLCIVQDDVIRYANSALTEMLKVPLDALIGESPLSLVHPDDRSMVAEQWRRRDTAEDNRFDAQFLRADGDSIPLEVGVSQLTVGGKPTLLATLTDISARKQAEQALLVALTENQMLRQQLGQEEQYLREQTDLKYHHGDILGHSEAITRALYQAERVAVTNTPVLLWGETGTGKELLAKRIHELSDRRGRPMVVVNCASLPATLIESELFGREAGAYTGAVSAQVGRFVVADGSTLFLDEVGEFPIELQAKLLRVLQDGRFERLGSPKTIKVDVRIIAATNRNLEQEVKQSRFRADLYHRLHVFPIYVPPLRERPEDIPLLTWAFVESFGRRMGKSVKNISRRTMQQLQRYDWPGNIRELSNVIERAMILSSHDTLQIELPTLPHEYTVLKKSLREGEREMILRVLQKTGWRIRGAGGAAECLDIKPTTLEARMTRLGITRPKKLLGDA